LDSLCRSLSCSFDDFFNSRKHLLDLRAPVTNPFDGFLYCPGFDASLLGSVPHFMLLPSGNQLSVTAATTTGLLGTFTLGSFRLGSLGHIVPPARNRTEHLTLHEPNDNRNLSISNNSEHDRQMTGFFCSAIPLS
jgi:hypothetical protein